ncbi:SDR family NAD(P)-dependent oxidoreductase [Micromonospora sp. NPDC093244]|uniref:SDR family NAD(P)-dependent oxidoreductase n=1 Tax=Micromonospora sp. NPDC093244 TaxID=3155071 RepID=UPI00341D97FA
MVTGANKGIGFATASQLVEQGHTVYTGARNAHQGVQARPSLGGQGTAVRA